MNPAGQSFHLVGIGGVGMSALAEILAARGARVSGSDRRLDQGHALPVFTPLAGAGVRLVPQDGKAVTAGLDALVVSSAVEPGNPDIEAARTLRLPILHRAELLAALAAEGRGVAVAGTSGKTTVTAMLGWALEAAGLDPVVVNGGALLDWQDARRTGSVRAGAGALWVFEADESDRSLLRFRPEHAVLTGIGADHFAIDEAVACFRAFAAGVRSPLITTRDAAARLGPDTPCTAVDAGGFVPEIGPDGSRFHWEGLDWTLPLPGLHNAGNALLAAAMCRELGADLQRVRDALAVFRGVHRRMECVLDTGARRVIDDMAHNPDKIRAAWSAAAPRGPVVGVWRPHGFAPLAFLFDALADMFTDTCRPGDTLFLLPVYYAGGTARGDRTSDDLAAALVARGVRAHSLPGFPELDEALDRTLRDGDTLLVMGARDPELPAFARRAATRWNARPEGNPKPCDSPNTPTST